MVEPDISEKNIENTTTTCDSPPLICPTSDTDRFAIRTTTFAELMSSPTSRKNGIASNASESTPSKIFWMIAASETSDNIAPTNTPASSENGTGTPIASLYAIIPLSGILIALFTIEQMVNGIRNGFEHPEPPEDDLAIPPIDTIAPMGTQP